jgi:transcriptional regulator with XRE-family HTH domain
MAAAKNNSSKVSATADDSSVIPGSPHEEFARRFERAMDSGRVDLPPKFKGRNEELARRMNDRFGVPVTPETISKWTKGNAYPRAERMAALASILGVDLAWLQMGAGGADPVTRSATSVVKAQPKGQRVTRGSAAKHLGLAMAELSGAPILDTPDVGDVHFTVAVGGGAVLSIHAALGERVGGGWRIRVPKSTEKTYVLGILPKTPTNFTAVELFWDDLVRVGTEEGDSLVAEIDAKLKTGDVTWTQIDNLVRRPRL